VKPAVSVAAQCFPRHILELLQLINQMRWGVTGIQLLQHFRQHRPFVRSAGTLDGQGFAKFVHSNCRGGMKQPDATNKGFALRAQQG
jgi:hypothetical protein